ncbi:MAG: TetR/AcrR family transcriptional regulator [Acidimicrobiales bacterium]
MPRNSVTATKPDRREQILDAALTCFLSQGLAATTIDQIRSESKASTGSLYHHFDGKESIAVALYLDRLTSYETGFLETLNATNDAKDGISAVVHHHLRWAQEHPADARFLLGHVYLERQLARSGDLPEQNRRFYGFVAEWIRNRVNQGHIRALPADLFYALWLGPAQELSRQWLNKRSTTQPTNAADLLADAAWNTLRA